MKYLCASFPMKIKVRLLMFLCNVGSGKTWNPSGCLADPWLKFRIYYFPFKFHNQSSATNTFLCRAFNETPNVCRAPGVSLPPSGLLDMWVTPRDTNLIFQQEIAGEMVPKCLKGSQIPEGFPNPRMVTPRISSLGIFCLV